jgi:DNA-binding NarL/FixJ family response regulator
VRALSVTDAAEGQQPTVVIADDHPVIRLGVRMALIRGGFNVVAEAASRASAVSAVLRERPDLCLLDLSMPGGGVEAAERIADLAPATSVVILTVSSDTNDVLAALRAGAVGYLTKDTSPARLPAALCGVLNGEAALPRALFGRVLRESREFTAIPRRPACVGEVVLTDREFEILGLLHSGLTTVEVGKVLALSPITVRRHVSTAVAKLGVADREAALLAIQPLANSATASAPARAIA